MDKGLCYKLPDAAYPRYKYFQQRLENLLQRWQRVLDAGNLAVCISQGKLILDKIQSAGLLIDKHVKVILFGSEAFLKTDSFDLTVQTKKKRLGDIHSEETTWNGFVQERKESSKLCVTVISIQSLDDKNVEALEIKLSSLSKAERSNIIVFIEDTKVNFMYNDLVKGKFILKETTKQLNLNGLNRSRALRKQIQYLFELKAVEVLEDIVDYNTKLIPKKPVPDDQSLELAIEQRFKESLSNSFIVQDLSPYRKSGFGAQSIEPWDDILLKLSYTVKSDWETLGPPLGISPVRIDEIKQSNQSLQTKVFKMLLLWKEHGEATLPYLFNLMKNTSVAMDIDVAGIEEIKQEFLAPSQSKIDQIFFKKLQDFVSMTTKCLVCEKLSQRYGIGPSLINEFLNDGFYGYESKVKDRMLEMTMPSWPKDHPDSGMKSCRMFLNSFHHHLATIVKETETYIEAKYEILTALEKLQFELFGLLQLTDVCIETRIPKIPELPYQLQRKLLHISEIYGCGTVWGVLELHLTSDLTPDILETINGLLSDYKYCHGYMTRVIEKPKTQAGGSIVEQGTSLIARRLDSQELKCGSVGCFVNITPKGVGNVSSELHCITCAHCVSECQQNIKVILIFKGTKVEEILGETNFIKYEQEKIDVATVKILEEQTRKCELGLMDSSGSPHKHSWGFYDGPIIRQEVFKYGSASQLTRGICVSTDWETKAMLNWNKDNGTNFHPDYNYLISNPGDVEPNTGIEGMQGGATASSSNETVFSLEGDSGSVVCNDDINTGEVVVISLLCGDIKEKKKKTKETKFLYSYSTNIQMVKKELEDEYNCTIEPANPQEEMFPSL